MSFFNSILQKLGLAKDETAAAPVAAAAAAPAKPAPVAKAVEKTKDDDGVAETAAAKSAVAAHAAPATPAMSEVDVVAKLEKMASGSELNWKVSIVDLLKVLDIDSSREARNDLAKELGCPDDLMGDSAKMNVWLHKEVLKKIAANGGNIPADLLN